MDGLLSRRDLLSLGAAGTAFSVMRRTGHAQAVTDSLSRGLAGAPADVVATYRADVAELDLAGRIVSTVAYNGTVVSRSTMRWMACPD
jgi:hypothetical protein